MIRAHMAGKMGDLLYALPVMRALSRLSGEKIHLTTSGMCWQLVPLLWEQPYFCDVVTDDTRPYAIPPGGMTTNWDFYGDAEGYNLSLQPKHYEMQCPINWTMAAAWIAGIEKLEPEDCVALPSLVNHRNWHHHVSVSYDGVRQALPNTIIVAPEVESLEPAPSNVWVKIIDALMGQGYDVVMVGRSSEIQYRMLLHAWHGAAIDAFHDVRGLTTVSTLARLIAEAHGFIGAHSFPWHLARHAGTPAICLQGWREGLRRCVPVDTKAEDAPWVEPEDWSQAVEWICQRTTERQLIGG
jgi:hypothetical protein